MSEQGQMMNKKIAREQLHAWRNMMALRPDDADAVQNCGSCLFTLGENEEALQLYDRAYRELDHGSAPIAMNLGMVLKDLGRFSESAEIVMHAYTLDPDFFYLRLGWAESLLRNGNWREAWELYTDARPMTKQGARNTLGLPPEIKEWRGEPLTAPDNKLLVLGEGGTGDRITYSRWLPELDKRGILWTYFPDAAPPIPGLQSLFERVPWLWRKVAKLGDKYEASHWTTVFSLPACFNAVPTKIPQYPAWFLPDPEIKKRYAIKKPDDKPVYGLIWGANELFEGGMKFRSLLESQAMRLVLSTCDMCHWVNCWQGDAHGTNYKLGAPVLNPKFENWEETAALLSNMDAVVTTDNGAGWLAQALGLPCSILLSGNSDWKFLRGTEKSYWSDRARLFRNGGQGIEDAVTKCINAIRNGEGVGWPVLSI
jgi:tetratricopeptide (TPR) repeat protein